MQAETARFIRAAGVLLAALCLPSRADGQPLPTGSEFQINSYTTSFQRSASVASDGDGDFVVVWQSGESSGGDTSGYSIQGQRYDSAGSAVGSQFQVNTYTTDHQFEPSVASDAGGDFVVVWQSHGSSGSDTLGTSIQGRRYDSAGSPVGSQFQVNTYITAFQRPSSVAADAAGNFVVVWQSGGSSGSDAFSYSVQGQRYDSAGSAVGSQFQVNTYSTLNQGNPSVAADADGDFVVVWDSNGSSGGDTSLYSVQGQRYASGGSAVGSEFQVNAYTTNHQARPSVAAGAVGDFVVVWSSMGSWGSDISDQSIQGRRYDSAGSEIGSQFQINTYTTSAQGISSVDAEADGDFVVVWDSFGSSGGDTSFTSIQGRRYTNVGIAVGGQFQVNTYTTTGQRVPSVAAEPGGDFVVVWASSGSSGGDTSYAIQGQRYTTVLAAPSLSSAGQAVAVLLMCLAVGIALRRRA